MGGIAEPARRLAAAVAVILFCGIAPAASSGPVLDSRPPGAGLRLAGPVTVAGTTPLTLDGLPRGSYRLRMEAPGGTVSLAHLDLGPGGVRLGSPGGPTDLFLPPGLGHFRQGATTRGWLFLSAAAAGAAGIVVEQLRWSDARDASDLARERYDRAVSTGEFDRARLDLLGANDHKADAENLRNIWTAYAGAAWVGAALETWILTPRPSLLSSGPDRYLLEAPGGSPAAAAVRSLLVPGAGQRFLGHPGRGNRFTGAVMVLGAGAIVAHGAFLAARRDQNDAQRRYDSAETENETVRWRGKLADESDRTRDWNRVRWGLVGAAAGVYLWNVIDAATLNPDTPAAPDMSWNVAPGPDGFSARLAWRIP